MKAFNTGAILPHSFARSSMVVYIGAINAVYYDPCAIFRYVSY